MNRVLEKIRLGANHEGFNDEDAQVLLVVIEDTLKNVKELNRFSTKFSLLNGLLLSKRLRRPLEALGTMLEWRNS